MNFSANFSANLAALRTNKALAQRTFELGLAFLLVLSNVFSSSLQSTLPEISHYFRLALTGGAIVLLLAKCLLFTSYSSSRQKLIPALILAYTAFSAWYGGDQWFFLAALLVVAAKDIDLRHAVSVYVLVAAVGLLSVQLLHLFTPLIPYKFYCRNWDFGYGHYNGYGARLIGVFFGWGWLRWPRLRWFDWAGLVALLLYTIFVPGSRGAAGGMLILLVLFVAQKLLPAFFESRFWHGCLLAVWPLFTFFSMLFGYLFNPAEPAKTPLLWKISGVLSGRFEIWHNVFWTTPASLLGGVATDGDEHHAIDNVFLALPMNKGILGALLVAVLFLLLFWRLCKNGHICETLCCIALLCYCLMENKLFLPTANPFLLLLPCVVFWPPDSTLPALAPKPQK